MRVVKWILGGLVALIVVFVVVGMLLPRNVTVARSIEINAAPEQVFPHVNSLKAASVWSPWLGQDPEAVLTYTGPEAGVGAQLSWASEHPNVGSGTQIIRVSDTNRRVETDLDFGDMGTARATYILEASDGKTTLTWDLLTDMGAGPIGRWMGLMMDDWVGADYERGLANLKALVEGQ